MSEANKELMRRLCEAGINNGDEDLMRELCHEDSIARAWAPSGSPRGFDAEWEAVQRLRAAIPGIHFTVEDVVAEGDKVVVRVIGRGTHTTDFMGIPATGKEFEFPLYDLARFDDGKLVEHWELFGMLNLPRQLGAQIGPAQT